jgi:hypothetical protein
MLDLVFLSGNYFYNEIPSEKEYMRQYFRTHSGLRFLVYYLAFSDLYRLFGFSYFLRTFVDHTGIACSRRWMQLLIRRYKVLDKTLAEAVKNADFDLINRVKTGGFVECLKR